MARAAWLIETRKWGEARPPIMAQGLSTDAAIADLFAIGFAAIRSGNRTAGGNALQQMAALMEESPINGAPATSLPGAGSAGDKRVSQVMAQQLEAVLLFSEGRREEALVLARQAAVVEAGLPFEFGPPVPVKPAQELVGEMLMDLRRPKEAIPAFEASLKRNPRRALSLLGLGRASMAIKDTARAMGAYGELRQMWKGADKGLPELKELGVVPPPS